VYGFGSHGMLFSLRYHPTPGGLEPVDHGKEFWRLVDVRSTTPTIVSSEAFHGSPHGR